MFSQVLEKFFLLWWKLFTVNIRFGQNKKWFYPFQSLSRCWHGFIFDEKTLGRVTENDTWEIGVLDGRGSFIHRPIGPLIFGSSASRETFSEGRGSGIPYERDFKLRINKVNSDLWGRWRRGSYTWVNWCGWKYRTAPQDKIQEQAQIHYSVWVSCLNGEGYRKRRATGILESQAIISFLSEGCLRQNTHSLKHSLKRTWTQPSTKNSFFRDTTLPSPTKINRRFEGICSFNVKSRRMIQGRN
jgi:hypothetical protein